MKKRLLMPMDLQFFAEGGADNGGSDNSGQDQNQSGNDGDNQNEKDKETGKSFTRDELAKIVSSETKKARASWESELEAKQKEAEKLAKMNAEEKLKHQLEQKEAEINELKRSQSLVEMSKEASKMLTEAELPVSEELLTLLVNEDAEKTSAAVKIVTDFASQIKKANARQTPPNEGGQFSSNKDLNQTKADLAQKHRIVK